MVGESSGLVHLTLFMTAGSISYLAEQGGWGDLGVSGAAEGQEN